MPFERQARRDARKLNAFGLNLTCSQVIEEYLRSNVDYYSFCHECLGSDRDLFSVN